MHKKGVTLIETMIAISLLGAVSGASILSKIESNKEEQSIKFINEAQSIIDAVDHRIAIDGYDVSKWTSKNWNNTNDIINNLIKKELTSVYLDNCSGGGWNPSKDSERKTKLITCKLWENKNFNNEKIKARLREDSVGFIQGFDLYIEFNNEKDFSE